ncbi:DNA polymerase/3'-5' exonuclease PolX [Olivibacter sp. SDN3]|uniref:DNA polymerase/3'-5' exonuclease PolX n=1 Tax=Olivibacter sp. SDN3 TaxID=2764720 RepID=UPI0016511AF0|nr:DNA polymerase/3'-5' exonuclease PolX [Olivibacter sp. SDN3]QNL49539.1 DNA polymerase/3'-5' exonuclease PolX [Olivibacter sp. SDN3]
MENKVIASKFKLLSQLMELHGGNLFKIKATAGAAFKLNKLPFSVTSKSEKELSEVPGIGKGTAAKVWELINTGNIQELDNLLTKTPEGILEMLTIKGIGPKKIAIIWHTLEIETLGELYYACNENRLIEAKGFGLKTQEEIKKAIEFSMANEGLFLYAQVEKIALPLLEQLKEYLPSTTKLSFTGAFRRKVEVLSTLDIITTALVDELQTAIEKLGNISIFERREKHLHLVHETGLPIKFIYSKVDNFYYGLLLSTGSESHVAQLEEALQTPIPVLSSEEAIYQSANLDYIEAELREGSDEIAKAKQRRLPNLLDFRDIKGSLHNHSTWSDGVHTLEEMASYCINELKLQYLGISDHSRSAVYANGLKEEEVRMQWQEIDRLNQKFAPFKIFKGIESDILSDGTLDYPEELLAGFDFIIASIHSNLKMDEERATARLIKAIENPYTTILGHPTGRLLLSRKGYPVDFKKVIDACAANKVVIEINANPLRLDLDWRWHQYALSKEVVLSINPDAHRIEGFHDMHYGILVGRKGGLDARHCLNCFDLQTVEAFFKQKKQL